MCVDTVEVIKESGRRRARGGVPRSDNMATVPSRGLVLKLYRQSLRHADKLVYTDKSFYKMRLREEFQKAKEPRGRRSLHDMKVGVAN